MAWERRGNQEYLYRKKRVGKRVISIYTGASRPAADSDVPLSERVLARLKRIDEWLPARPPEPRQPEPSEPAYPEGISDDRQQ